jgi:hypothetical protein
VRAFNIDVFPADGRPTKHTVVGVVAAVTTIPPSPPSGATLTATAEEGAEEAMITF